MNNVISTHTTFTTYAWYLFLLQSNGQNDAHTIPNQGLFANTGYLQMRPAVSAEAGVLFRF